MVRRRSDRPQCLITPDTRPGQPIVSRQACSGRGDRSPARESFAFAVCLAFAVACDNFLYGFKRTFGAPCLTAGTGNASWREQPGESRAARGPAISGKGRRGSRRCGAAAFAALFGRKPYGATSCRARLPRHRPQPVPAVTPRCRATRAGPGRHARAECADRRAKGHCHRGRNAAH